MNVPISASNLLLNYLLLTYVLHFRVQTDVTATTIDSVTNSLNEKTREVAELKETLSAVEKVFSKNQISKLKHQKRIQWSTTEIANSIVLYAAGPRAYRLMLKKGFPYPAVSTLRAWLKKIKIQPGILKNIFKLVEFSDFNNNDRVCIIMFDEIKIRKEYIYDRLEDEILKPFAYAQVVMMRGLFKSWKQPIFYDYDFKMTAKTLFEIINFLESSGMSKNSSEVLNFNKYYSAGFPVVAMVSDLGGGNRGLHTELEISKSKPHFLNPCNGEKIYVFADVPHLLKLIRNHFVDQGFIHNNGKEINKSIVESTLDATAVSDLKITHKISKETLNVVGAQRQKVKFAAKLFSHTISKAISRCGTLGYLPGDMNWTECADFFKTVRISLQYILFLLIYYFVGKRLV